MNRFYGKQSSNINRCKSYVAIREMASESSDSSNNADVRATNLLARGCNMATLDSNQFVSTLGQVSVSINYHEACPHHAGVLISTV